MYKNLKKERDGKVSVQKGLQTEKNRSHLRVVVE
jgi:hypothetical protein